MAYQIDSAGSSALATMLLGSAMTAILLDSMTSKMVDQTDRAGSSVLATIFYAVHWQPSGLRNRLEQRAVLRNLRAGSSHSVEWKLPDLWLAWLTKMAVVNVLVDKMSIASLLASKMATVCLLATKMTTGDTISDRVSNHDGATGPKYRTYTQHAEDTARHFTAFALRAMAHLMRVAVSPLSFPHFSTSDAGNSFGLRARGTDVKFLRKINIFSAAGVMAQTACYCTKCLLPFIGTTTKTLEPSLGDRHPVHRGLSLFVSGEIWAALNVEVLRADEGESRRVWSNGGVKGQGNGRSPSKPADQRHRSVRFSHAKIRERPRRSKANMARLPAGHFRIFARGNCAGRCRWSAGFLRDILILPPLHSSVDPYRSRFTLIGRAQRTPGRGSLVMRNGRLASRGQGDGRERGRQSVIGLVGGSGPVELVKHTPVAAKLLDYSPPTKANRVRFPAGSLPDLRMWESCRTMPLVCGFSLGSHVFPALAFRRCFILASLHPHRLSRRPNLPLPLPPVGRNY
ncbi:hypothetical protein PR048_018018 [Dryococelus australis]|uniref:Uncharacterized protein n=1 Tax=Dryococelus australis TaxID=614101 RepID=A0ABQ9HB37_9NEOP|nr:hypothetical protein PR048_018018 [Dryococelus australis]